jgi:hypothetical protein
MAVYEAVPADEAASQGATRDHVGQPIESKKTAQVYVQVPSEDRDRAQRHVEGRCINSFLLMGLSFVFASCSLTIGLLYHFSRVENGLTTEKESHRYAWIYGPTAGTEGITTRAMVQELTQTNSHRPATRSLACSRSKRERVDALARAAQWTCVSRKDYHA